MISSIVDVDKLESRTTAEYRLVQLSGDHTIHQVEDGAVLAHRLHYFKLRLEVSAPHNSAFVGAPNCIFTH